MSGRGPKRSKVTRDAVKVARDDEGGLGRVMAQAQRIDALDHLLKPLLPKDIAAQVRVANLRDGCLVLAAPSGAVATRLRMESVRLLAALKDRGHQGIRHIEVRIAPPARDRSATRRRRPLSEAAREALSAMGMAPDK